MSSYAVQYLFIALLTLVAVALAVIPLILSKFLAPKKPSPSKLQPYECGLDSSGDPWIQFDIQYYVYALLFVVFDVEVILLYPWAMVWKSVGAALALAEMGIFIAIVGVALVYAWKKGVLEWK